MSNEYDPFDIIQVQLVRFRDPITNQLLGHVSVQEPDGSWHGVGAGKIIGRHGRCVGLYGERYADASSYSRACNNAPLIIHKRGKLA